MPHEVQSSIPAHKSRTPKVEGVSKLPGARVTGAASRGRRLTWQRCGMGQRTHAAAWLFQWWERVPGRRINGSGPERAPCRWATPEHEQERDAGLQALSHWWLRETYCRILCQAPVKQVSGGVYIVWARKSICRVGIVNVEANVATRHDILVYLLEANVAGNVATSMQRPMDSSRFTRSWHLSKRVKRRPVKQRSPGP